MFEHKVNPEGKNNMSFNKSVTRIKKIDNPEISDKMVFNGVFQGSKFVDLTHTRIKTMPVTRKISKNQYVFTKDTKDACAGEIREYKKNETGKRFSSNMINTFNHIRWLIRHNFETNADNQLFITLTYKENMKDPARLYEDFRDFWKRFKRHYKSHHLEYMTVAEPQGRGAWHMHLLVKSDKPVLIAMNKEVRRLWGHGITKTIRPECEDIGTYLVTYFTDVVYNDDGSEATLQQIMQMSEEQISKKKVKGARLPYYPPHMKFYRRSKGIVDPPERTTTYGEAKKEYGEPVFTREYVVMSDDDFERYVNSVVKANFKKRKRDDDS